MLIFAVSLERDSNIYIMKKILYFAAAVLVLCSFTPKNEAERYADSLLRQMTLREKLGQMSQFIPKKGVVTGPEGVKIDLNELIKAGEVGSMFNFKTPEQIEEMQRLAVDSSRLGIPLLIGHDIIHGCKVIFPINLACACTWNVEGVRKSAEIAAYEAAAMGVAWTFSPMCDVSADPRWGRVSEGSGEDPYLGARICAAMVEGYQGADLADSTTILACVKHFLAYGAPEAGREYNTVDMSQRMFRDRYLPPYKMALEAGAATVMSSFNDFDCIPASGNKWALKTLLRDELGFKGFVVSDYNAVKEMVIHGVAADEKEAARMALESHLDMEMVSTSYLKYAEQLIAEGVISEEHINNLCRNILVAKYNLGLFDDPYRYGGVHRFQRSIYKPEHMQFAREVARESMVLLKNEEKTLPISSDKKIALIGPYVSCGEAMLGSWIAFGEEDKAVTIGQGMKERFGENLKVVQGCEPFNHIPGGMKEAVKAAKKSDVVVLTLGLPGNLSGEASSLTTVEIPDAQKELLAAVKATGKPVVVLLVTGRPMALESVEDKMDALLVVWHPGTMGGHAVADLLSGDYSPSGHLAMTFPRCDGQIPIRYNHKNTGRPTSRVAPQPTHKAKKPYSSCYMFTPSSPLYDFGFGLSYTEFVFDELQVLDQQVELGENVRVKVKVTNAGDRDGATVAQLYIRDLVASTTRPVRELKGFKRVNLKAGESTEIEFVITPEDMAFCREDMKFAQESGDFKIWVGNTSQATLEGKFTVK